MKKAKNLYAQIHSWQNLLTAAKKARLRKRYRPDVLSFHDALELNLFDLKQQLQTKNYQPQNYHQFYVHDPKKRWISAPPYRDRIVHHALCQIIEPIFEKTFIHDLYSCRKGKGSHKAVHRLQDFSQNNMYVLKCDIERYFPSIDIDILFLMYQKKIACKETLSLLEQLLFLPFAQEVQKISYFPQDDLFSPWERTIGLPIGTQISQLSANIYLSFLDRFLKEKLKCRYYLRYGDDFCILSSDKIFLHFILKEIQHFLCNLRLHLHQNKCQIFPVRQGINWLGFRIFPHKILLQRQNYKRARKRLRFYYKKVNNKQMSLKKWRCCLHAWIGHAKHADSYGLRKKLFSEFVFRRSTNDDKPFQF